MGFTLRTFFYQVLPVSITVILLIVSLFLLDSSTSSPEAAENIERWLAPLNLITLTILSVLIIVNLIRALRHLRSKKAGSRFNLRLMTAFAILTILPALVVSYFSMNFIGEKIDSWYDVDIERALGDSLELAQRSLKTGTSLHLRDIELTARELFKTDETAYSYFLDQKRIDLNAYEMLLLDSNKRVVAYSGINPDMLFDNFPEDTMFRVLSSRGFYLELEPGGNDELYSRVAVTLQKDALSETYTLTALFPVSRRFTALSESVQEARDQYQTRKFHRNSIKYGFRISLFIILLLSVLFALWAAFIYSQKLTSPIRKLLDGTLAVASGDLQKKLPVSAKDDFSLLARSFNTMTTKLLSARRESDSSRLQVQRQHDYLNIVLNHLTSGVITLDESLTIRRINAAGEQLLQLELGKNIIGKKFSDIGDYSESLADFIQAIVPHLQSDQAEWKTEIMTLTDNKRRMFVCQGVTLPELINGDKGVVLVLDDMTEIVQAEHDAAWAEVAQRLAHEIKNPLTPIQLSAERLQHRLLPEVSESSADLLKRMTQTITQQVESMKTMVNAFSEYARTPSLQLQQSDINKLISEVAELYHSNQQHVKIQLALEELPLISIDVHRMRQVIVNLLKNSLEALEKKEQPRIVTISTQQTDMDEILIRVSDNGPGIEASLLPELFDPYVSNKQKGSGLGLAIVKKIIEEHSGNISVRNNDTEGAIFTILLPMPGI
ncbi:MAG TPA: HAMP domain-containing protein [Thiothrix sp.]|nr:HAMP domain-containing protein [Thiothrix sp.]